VCNDKNRILLLLASTTGTVCNHHDVLFHPYFVFFFWGDASKRALHGPTHINIHTYNILNIQPTIDRNESSINQSKSNQSSQSPMKIEFWTNQNPMTENPSVRYSSKRYDDDIMLDDVPVAFVSSKKLMIKWRTEEKRTVLLFLPTHSSIFTSEIDLCQGLLGNLLVIFTKCTLVRPPK
jgi:hypothetical protein